MPIKRILFNYKSLAGLLISTAGLYWAFKGFNFFRFLSIIKDINIGWIFVAALILLLSVLIRGLRWKYLFKDRELLPASYLVKASFIGYFGNNVLPLRLGEILRCVVVSNKFNLSKSYVFGTILMERLIDFLTLIFLSILLYFISPIQSELYIYTLYFVALTFVVCICVVLSMKFVNRLNADNKIVKLIKNTFEGLLSINRDKKMMIAITSLLIWGFYWLEIYLIQLAFNFTSLDIISALFILVIVSIIMAIPSAPGMIGTYHAAIIFVMSSVFLIDNDTSGSFALIKHAVMYFPYTIVGFICLISIQNYSQLLRRSIKNDS